MTALDHRCIMPPSPELLEQIQASLHRLKAGDQLPNESTTEYLDAATLTQIITRPPKTRAHTLVSPTREWSPVTGNRKAIVLLVDFSDEPATEQPSHFRDLLFSQGTYPTGSMRDFYHEASYGQLDVTGEVSGGSASTTWYRAPKPKSYYTNGDYGFSAYPKNAQKLVEDVLDLAAPHVDFSSYDNDGDSHVEALVIVAAGSGGEATGDVNDIWSHKWGINPRTLNGVTISEYFMAPEDGRVGVMAHELGHLLMGWPDLYDTDYSSAGTGAWDLMAGGSWNNAGHTPAHPSGWCKTKVGWVNPTTLFGTSQSVAIQDYATAADVYKLPIGSSGSKEYFLLSNRQQSGFDTHLPGSGLVIEHIDENQTNNTDETHYLVDIEQCDGNQDLNKNANRGDATDPFPCGGSTSFDDTSTPSSKAYDGSASQVAVTNIQNAGGTVTADIGVGAVSGPTWTHSARITAAYVDHSTQWAWAHVDGVGWRRIKDGAPDGVSNVFTACCDAVAHQRIVSVSIDAQFLYTMYLF